MATTDTNRLLDIEAIKQLKAEYCRFVDTKQWDRLFALFAEETVFEGFGSAPTGSTALDFIKGISHRMKGAVTIHHVCNPEIAFLGPDRARGIWAMTDLVERPPACDRRRLRTAEGSAATGITKRSTGATVGAGSSASCG